jgi:undecaprenyl diphosphate synthase
MDLSDLRHLAIIMDGNGRWAKSRGWRRTRGHRAGVDSVRNCVTECARAGLPWLTLYALSTENYRARPATEVRTLMALLRRFMIDERPTLMENRVRLETAGRLDELPDKVVRTIRETEAMTAGNSGMTLCLALNYGGRSELADAAKEIARSVKSGKLDLEAVDESAVAARLYQPKMPDVDLLIRTAGEVRISNFLLWQVSYAEIWVTETCWPDFRQPQLEAAVSDFRRRSRRFGGLLPGEKK